MKVIKSAVILALALSVTACTSPSKDVKPPVQVSAPTQSPTVTPTKVAFSADDLKATNANVIKLVAKIKDFAETEVYRIPNDAIGNISSSTFTLSDNNAPNEPSLLLVKTFDYNNEDKAMHSSYSFSRAGYQGVVGTDLPAVATLKDFKLMDTSGKDASNTLTVGTNADGWFKIDLSKKATVKPEDVLKKIVKGESLNLDFDPANAKYLVSDKAKIKDIRVTNPTAGAISNVIVDYSGLAQDNVTTLTINKTAITGTSEKQVFSNDDNTASVVVWQDNGFHYNLSTNVTDQKLALEYAKLVK
jgi:hypothetical protein